ncbi:hypothetical protein C6A85_05925, partial [Mycobacterium sp. ITM-2017-0098]
ARRAQTIQADLRDARLRLAADDLVTRKAEFDDTNQAETTLRRVGTLVEVLYGAFVRVELECAALQPLGELIVFAAQ